MREGDNTQDGDSGSIWCFTRTILWDINLSYISFSHLLDKLCQYSKAIYPWWYHIISPVLGLVSQVVPLGSLYLVYSGATFNWSTLQLQGR